MTFSYIKPQTEHKKTSSQFLMQIRNCDATINTDQHVTDANASKKKLLVERISRRSLTSMQGCLLKKYKSIKFILHIVC